MTEQAAKRPLAIKISLAALEHLGMNLYSTIPAVLSEIVANAWDADAGRVLVTLGEGQIAIEDDGVGMTRDQVIDRFLDVGFQRRKAMGARTAKGRPPMGRKGIGKLSSFSIANVVTVYTTSGGEHTAFRMDAQRIREQMRQENRSRDSESQESQGQTGACPVEELDEWPDALNAGTRIVLTGLKHQATAQTTRGLRQRIARRFSVIGPQEGFAVVVDGERVSPSDRGYDQHVEYCWTYGDSKGEIPQRFVNLADNQPSFARALPDSALNLTGWIGTVKKPNFLKAEGGDNLNRLAVFMRGKVAQEDLLGDFGFKEIFADYVVGEIHCDDLDQDDDEDIATSSRQALKHDDPRFTELRDFVRGELRYIASQWTELRNQQGAKVFCRDVPAVAGWLEALQGDTKKKAERWIGRLNVLPTGDEAKRELLKASILAFENYRWKEQLDFLGNVSNESIETVLRVFKDIADLERSYYGQIAKGRLQIIDTLEDKLNADEKERVIRDHIYENLWLLDPSWDIVEGTQKSERTITTFLQSASQELTDEERRGRIDIGYRTAGGAHVIIELKRASVRMSIYRLMEQIAKYRNAVEKLIPRTGYSSFWPVEVICLMGERPTEYKDNPGLVRQQLATLSARVVLYDELLGNARRAYAEYLEEHKKIDRLSAIFDAIDDFAAAQVDDPDARAS